MYLTRKKGKTNNFQKGRGQNLLVSISVPCRHLLDHNPVTAAYINADFEGHEIYTHFISQFLACEPNGILESEYDINSGSATYSSRLLL